MRPIIWIFPLSFASQKALLGLEEKKIDYETRKVNILLGDNFNADYIKVNGNGTVPTLIDGATEITDSTDILRYADSKGEPLGGDKVDRSKVEEWFKLQTSWDDNTYTYARQGKQISSYISNFRLKVLEARARENPDLSNLYEAKISYLKKGIEDFQNKVLVEALHSKLLLILDSAESQLNTTPYLAGEAFSMADVTLITILNRVEVVNEGNLITERPALAKYWTEAKKRASYKKVIGPVAGSKALPTVLTFLGTALFRNTFKKY